MAGGETHTAEPDAPGTKNSETGANDYLLPWEGPAILLVDLDAFFASVEQLDHPAWRGKPVIVGGDADKHGVVSTCSYEARAFGVRSAMAASLARQLCPQAIWTHGHYDRYREVSDAIMSIIGDETPHVQQVSIDEAFADITPTQVNREHPIRVAERIQARVEELGVTCSIGLGTTKSVAKIASDRDKPHGLTVVYPGGEAAFLGPLPVRTMSGIGPAAEKTLVSHGIRTLGDLAVADEGLLRRAFGKNAQLMRDRARGREASVVMPDNTVKSVSNEVTFADDLSTNAEVLAALGTIAAKVGRRLRRKGLTGRTLSLKIRFDNRTTKSVQRQLPTPTNDEIAFTPLLREMLHEVWREGMRIRLLGVGVSGFDAEAYAQEALFEDVPGELAGKSAHSDCPGRPRPHAYENPEKRRSLINATDALKDRFGESAVRFGRELRNEGNTTGSSAKNPADYR